MNTLAACARGRNEMLTLFELLVMLALAIFVAPCRSTLWDLLIMEHLRLRGLRRSLPIVPTLAHTSTQKRHACKVHPPGSIAHAHGGRTHGHVRYGIGMRAGGRGHLCSCPHFVELLQILGILEVIQIVGILLASLLGTLLRRLGFRLLHILALGKLVLGHEAQRVVLDI